MQRAVVDWGAVVQAGRDATVNADVFQAGVVNYYGGARRYAITGLPVPGSPDVGWLKEQPSRLLDARSRVVPFVGREAELRYLEQWRDDDHDRLSVLLLHGLGGQGKTRLAHEFAERSRGAGHWQVLQAELGGSRASSEANAAGVLLVVDYADRWALSELERLLSDPLLDRRPARVLMIGRTVRWFAALRGGLSDRRAAVDDLLLPPLSRHRYAMFTAARDRFGAADLYDVADAVPPPAELAEHPDFGLTLTVHMAALVAVDAYHRGTRPPTTPHELSAYLLDREYQAWQRLSEAGAHGQDFRTRPAVMARTVFTAALTGAVDQAAGTRAIRLLDLPGHPQDLLVDHRFCYPPADRELVLEPLYPDRLAEDFLALFTPGHDITAYDPDPWAKDVPAYLLAGDHPDLRSRVVARAVTFLASAAERWPHIGAKMLYPLLRDDPALALEAGSAALTSLAAIEDIPDDILTAVERLLPEIRQVDLDVGAAAITAAYADRMLPRTDDPADKADIHLLLSERLVAAGRREEALEHSGLAVELRRGLLGTDRIANRSRLARALLKHAEGLTVAGRHAEALEHSGQAITLFPDPSSPHFATQVMEHAAEQALFGEIFWGAQLADAMSDHALRLDGVGRRAEGLDHSQQALDMYEAVAASGQDVPQNDWALALDQHAARLRRIGKLPEALTASERALRLRTELAETDRAAYLPDLAVSLNNHSIRLVEVGRDAEALACLERAVALGEELVAVNRAAYRHDLASSLVAFASLLSEAGQHTRALACSAQAVDLYEELAETATAYLPKLAIALSNRVNTLADAGRHADALACSERCIAIFDALDDRDRANYLHQFANALHNHALRLVSASRLAEGIDTSRRIVEIREQLLAEGDADHCRLVEALQSHATWLTDARRYAEAVNCSLRAVSLIGEPTGTTSVEDLFWWYNHSVLLAKVGDHEKAFAVSERVVAEWETRADHREGLAMSLANHAVRLADRGWHVDALSTSERALALAEQLVAEEGDAHLPLLARALHNHSQRLRRAGRPIGAQACARKSVALFARLASNGLS